MGWGRDFLGGEVCNTTCGSGLWGGVGCGVVGWGEVG